MSKTDFRREQCLRGYPNSYFIDQHDMESLEEFLRKQGWLSLEEHLIHVEKAGDGNMNLTLRITTSSRSIIVKQSRPWVEKYPQIPAPIERVLVEGLFYQAIDADTILQSMSPKLIGVDPTSSILSLEDLGKGEDFTFLYRGKSIEVDDADQLINYLSSLHRVDVKESRPFLNRAIRELNHEHLFHLPFQAENGVDLDQITFGLNQLSRRIKKKPELLQKVSELGTIYLNNKGGSLLHGDFYPGSWLKSENKVAVIDSEFCFIGPPEFDLGVMFGHLILTGHSKELLERLLKNYSANSRVKCNSRLVFEFAGVEIMRRILGVAQLPLTLSLAEKDRILNLAGEMILSLDLGASI